jgi:pimeloyl-ACP methyl ester carboxylesterase
MNDRINVNYDPVRSDPINRDSEKPASMTTMLLDSEGEKLVGTIFIPQGKGPHPVLLLLHGFPGNEVNFDLAHAARRDGWLVIVFHYRGGWGSSGSYSFSNCIEDTNNVIKYLSSEEFISKYNTAADQLVIVGHSLGGFISLKKST